MGSRGPEAVNFAIINKFFYDAFLMIYLSIFVAVLVVVVVIFSLFGASLDLNRDCQRL